MTWKGAFGAEPSAARALDVVSKFLLLGCATSGVGGSPT